MPDKVIDELLALLDCQVHTDFRPYRRSMIVQRIERRMRQLNLQHVETYLQRCQSSPSEVRLLGREIFSGVTQFFRDPEAFEYLGNTAIPALIRKGASTGRIRIWVAGCATGEEAYSVAMLLREKSDELASRPEVHIFATDVDPQALEVADRGVYTESRIADISPARVKRFFHRRGDHYQVIRSLRDMLIFAPHNLLEDPPLAKMDLIVCRHILIYMDTPFHAKILTPIQFALQPNGFLFLGQGESPGELAHLFQVLDAKWHVYRKIHSLPLSGPAWMPPERSVRPLQHKAANTESRRSGRHQQLVERTVDHLLATYCPPTLLINDQLEILHIIGDVSPYMKKLSGIPSFSVLQLLHDDLCLPIRTVLQRLKQAPEDILYHHVPVRMAEGCRYLTLRGHREAFTDNSSDVIVLCLEAVEWGDHVRSAAPEQTARTPEQERLEALEQMLRHAQETLQATIGELEASNLALQTGHEAISASNDALLMANEELQATNEELYTLNGEYQNKIAELTRLTNDMDNLLRSTEIGTIFLDTELRLRRFTPAIAESFHLLPRDIGRPLDHMTSRLEDEQLLPDALQVLCTGVPIVQEVRKRPDRWMLRRLTPYRTEQGRCEGVVLTFVDVSDLKTAEAMLQRSEKRFRDLIEESVQGILIYRSGRPLFVNRACAQLFGYASPQDILALDDLVADIAAPHEYTRLWHYTQRLLEDGNPPMHHEFQGQRQDGRLIWVENAMRCVMWEGACAVQSTMVDITERKRAEEALARKTLELQRSNDDLEQFAYVASNDLQEPLGMVSSYLYLLQDRCAGQLEADAEQFIAFAVDGAGRMQQLIRDLLAYARLGQQALVLKSIAGDIVLDAALETLRVALKDSGGKVTRDKLPTVRVDPAQLELLLRNLIDNAIKFRGKKRPHIRIHADFRGDAWLFSVQDHGIGLDPKDAEHIFTLFQRLHPRDVYTGTGIGLALCKRIVERHGGRIWVESQLGEGATFTFTLPA
ncbi:CheR family methyltransferase [Candidatus Entotheonella palauensis]|uniref:CheR family methyltransferase n=1 Tax=Candidatus Entotheonella palauensis TaxID=93172 RepID=UPI0015C43C26|nr:CheR family methyltransferase [Candidatus Entotheonella palauensis]